METIKRYGITLIVDDDRMVVLEGREKNFQIVSKITEEQRGIYFRFRGEICPHQIDLHNTPFVDKLLTNEVYGFIIEELSGKWYRTKGIVFCFELEIDAMAFKLRWL